MSQLIDQLLTVPAPAAYALISALGFAEAAIFVGFVLPGETAVLLGGVLASTGTLSLPAVLVLVVASAILGDSVGYEVGRRVGPRILQWRALTRHRGRLDAAQQSLRERGGWAVFLGRFTAFLRAVMPALTGLSGMPYPRFLVFNAAGGLVWGVGVTLLGYFAGQSYQQVATLLSRSSAGLILVVVAVGLTVWWLRRRRRTADRDETRGASKHETTA